MHFARRCLLALLAFSPVFAGSVPGIENFDQVDAHVYRGAQPTDEGFRYLAKLGVKTIIDLREADDRAQSGRARGYRSGHEICQCAHDRTHPAHLSRDHQDPGHNGRQFRRARICALQARRRPHRSRDCRLSHQLQRVGQHPRAEGCQGAQDEFLPIPAPELHQELSAGYHRGESPNLYQCHRGRHYVPPPRYCYGGRRGQCHHHRDPSITATSMSRP